MMNTHFTTYFEGKRVACEVKGSGSPVMLLHGFGMERSVWLPFAKKLTENHRLILPDMSGFGESELLEDYTIEAIADSLIRILDDLGEEKCVLIGHSMGGYVALSFADRAPERLNGLGLFHSHPFADSDEKKQNRNRTIEFVKQYGTAPFVREFMPKLFAPDYLKNNTEIIAERIAIASQFAPNAIIAATAAMRERIDRSNVLMDLKVPVLFIIGVLDATLPIQDSLRQTHLPSVATVHLLEGVSHMGMYESREKTLAHIEEFIAFCCMQA